MSKCCHMNSPLIEGMEYKSDHLLDAHYAGLRSAS